MENFRLKLPPHLRQPMVPADEEKKKKRGAGASTGETLETKWEKRRCQLFDHAVGVHERATAGQSRMDIPNRTRPWGEKASRRWKTPSVILSIKNKCLPLVSPVHIPYLKCREIFTQANLVWGRAGFFAIW